MKYQKLSAEFNLTSKFFNGFTLVELLVVIAIIGILSSVVLASLNSARLKSIDAKRLSDIRQIANAILLYSEDHNYNYPTPEDSINGWGVMQTQLAPYLAKIPVDPVGGTSGPPNWQYYQF